MRIAVVDMIDAIAAAEIAAHLDRISSELARNPAIKGDPICRAVNNFDQVFPAIKRGHDLVRAAAQGKWRIVGVKRQAHICFLRNRDYSPQEISDVGPHLLQRVRTLVG